MQCSFVIVRANPFVSLRTDMHCPVKFNHFIGHFCFSMNRFLKPTHRRPSPPPSDWSSNLPDYVERARRLAEKHFGPGSEIWTAVSGFGDQEQPQVFIKSAEKIVTMRLSKVANAGSDGYAAMHEIGHEALHMISPVLKQDVTNLEEGCACWMANEFREVVTAHGRALGIPKHPSYVRPATLVFEMMRRNPGGIKKLRSTGRKFSDITPGELKTVFPWLSGEDVAFLTDQAWK